MPLAFELDTGHDVEVQVPGAYPCVGEGLPKTGESGDHAGDKHSAATAKALIHGIGKPTADKGTAEAGGCVSSQLYEWYFRVRVKGQGPGVPYYGAELTRPTSQVSREVSPPIPNAFL